MKFVTSALWNIRYKLLFFGVLGYVIAYLILNWHSDNRYHYKGKVYDEASTPIEGVKIALYFLDGIAKETFTKADGAFSFKTNNGNLKRISASKDGYIFHYRGESLLSLSSQDFLGWVDELQGVLCFDTPINNILSGSGTRLALDDNYALELSAVMDSHEWELVIKMDLGSLLVSDVDLISHAPMRGFQEQVIFSSKDNPFVHGPRVIYFRTQQNGRSRFGWVELFFDHEAPLVLQFKL